MNKIRKIDDNQQAIVKGLRKLGASVAVTSSLGNGFPDIVVGYRGKNFLFEIKDGAKPLSAQRLTEREGLFFKRWAGDVRVIRSISDAMQWLTLNNKLSTFEK